MNPILTDMENRGFRRATEEEVETWRTQGVRALAPEIDKVRLVYGHGLWVHPAAKLLLVCRQCDEEFEEMASALDHGPGKCGSYQGFDVTSRNPI